MATSGSSNFSITRNDIIKQALLNVGAIGQGETPTSTQYTDGAFLLNLIVKAWAADGMPVWAIKQTSFPFVADTNSYTIGSGATVDVARPLKVISAFVRSTESETDQPVEVITRAEYDGLTSKSATGLPIKLYYDSRGGATATGIIYVWPSPDSGAVDDRTMYITYQRPYEDFDASSDEPDFPQEWFMALVWQLSWAFCPSYGVPLEERKLIMAEAEKLHREARDFSMEEGSVYVEPQSE